MFEQRATPVEEFAAGACMLSAGFGMLLRSPKLLLLGALPALICFVLLLASLGVLLYSSGDITT